MRLFVGVGAVLAAVAAVIVSYFRDDGPGAEARAEPQGPQPPTSGSRTYEPAERYPPEQKRRQASSEPIEPRSNKNVNAGPTDDGARGIQTTKRHLWMLDLTVGDVVTNERLATELDIKPAFGWHQDRSIILAILLEPGRFYVRMGRKRLRITPNDYGAAALPPISHQAVPILSAYDDGWRFEGFFRLGHPTAISVACELIDGAPPELGDLSK